MSFLYKADLSLTPSVTPESTTASQACKKGKKSSPIWVYTCMPLEDKNPDLLYCSYCKQGPVAKQALYGSESSLAITKYINRYHLLIIIEKATNKKQEVVN